MRKTKQEWIVLVDEQGGATASMLKYAVHGENTPRHLGFSVFLFNPVGEVLIQQRAAHKVTWPLVWAGSCCGHPRPGESMERAVRRRVKQELGVCDITELCEALPTFQYRCSRGGIEENEFCPVWVGRILEKITPFKKEVEAVEWIRWPELVHRIQQDSQMYAEWLWLEVEALEKEASPLIRRYSVDKSRK